MKLYYAPNACSLADHIALLDVGQSFDVDAVDLRTKRTASGSDFHDINPKGYVPALVLDDGQTITENIAVLDWIAEQYPALRPTGSLSRTRLLEMLTFISTEIHRAFKPLWHAGAEAEKQKARETVASLLQFTATHLRGTYLFGEEMSAADCYLFVMLRWADRFGVAVPESLRHLRRQMDARPSVQAALEQEEGLRSRGVSRAASPAGHADQSVNTAVRETPSNVVSNGRSTTRRWRQPITGLRTGGWCSSTRKCQPRFPDLVS